MLGVRDYNVRLVTRNALVNGKRVPDTVGEAVLVPLSMQPVSGSMLKNISDSIRESVKAEVYAFAELQSYDKATFHQVEVEGEWFNIHAFQNWTTLLKHFRYVLVKQ